MSRRSEKRGAAPGRRWQRALLLAALACEGAWSGSASAQTSTITIGRVGRYSALAENQDPDKYKYRTTRPWWISYADCINDDVFVFPLQLSDASHRLEVWAGNDDCVAKRGNTTERGQCWLVGSAEHLERSITVNVPVRNVVLRDLSSLSVPVGVDADVCQGSTDSDGNKVTFYFLIEDSGKAVGSGATWTGGAQGTGFDLVGPPPPTGISLSMGDSQLTLDIGDLTDDTELKSLEAFCAPAEVRPAADAAADAGTSGDAGEFIPGSSACYSSLLTPGQQPPIEYACGKVSKSSGSIRTNTLDNGIPYAVGVAGEDVIGNPGVLSAVQCGTPEELDDFFELYTRNGGRGGGGFCSVSPGTSASTPGALALLGMLLATLRVRRRRSRA